MLSIVRCLSSWVVRTSCLNVPHLETFFEFLYLPFDISPIRLLCFYCLWLLPVVSVLYTATCAAIELYNDSSFVHSSFLADEISK